MGPTIHAYAGQGAATILEGDDIKVFARRAANLAERHRRHQAPAWLVLTERIVEKEIALSGSEQNPDITSKDRRAFLRDRLFRKGAPGPVEVVEKCDQSRPGRLG